MTGPQATQVRSLVVPAGIVGEFLATAHRCGVTLGGALYAVLCALLAADTGDPDVRLLAVNTARRSEDIEHIAGFFLDSVLVRHRLCRGRPVPEAFIAASRDLHDALRHDSITISVLSQMRPHIAEVFGSSQSVAFEMLPSVVGLQLGGCSVERTDVLHAEFAGRMFKIPTQLAVLARREGSALRLAAIYDPSFVPVSYVDGLLARMRDLAVDSAPDGAPPLDELARADPWLTSLREATPSPSRIVAPSSDERPRTTSSASGQKA